MVRAPNPKKRPFAVKAFEILYLSGMFLEAVRLCILVARNGHLTQNLTISFCLLLLLTWFGWMLGRLAMTPSLLWLQLGLASEFIFFALSFRQPLNGDATIAGAAVWFISLALQGVALAALMSQPAKAWLTETWESTKAQVNAEKSKSG